MPSKPPAKPDAPDLPAQLERAPAGGPLDRLELECALLEGADFSGQQAWKVRFDQCRLTRVDFGAAQLAGGSMQDVAVLGGSWTNARTSGLHLRRASFRDVRMTGVDFASASLEDVAFVDCRIDLAFFVAAKLNRVQFERCRLDEVDFSDAGLGSVTFRDCALPRSIWADAKVRDSEMRGCDISGAVHLERLRGLRVPMADVLASAADLATALGLEVVD